MKTPSYRQWRTLFALWSIQGLLAFFWLLAIPTDTDHPIAFGFSVARLVLVMTALLLGWAIWIAYPSAPPWYVDAHGLSVPAATVASDPAGLALASWSG